MEEINLEKYEERIFGKNTSINRIERKDGDSEWYEADLVTLKKKKEKPKIKYKVFNMRLHEETRKKLEDNGRAYLGTCLC